MAKFRVRVSYSAIVTYMVVTIVEADDECDAEQIAGEQSDNGDLTFKCLNDDEKYDDLCFETEEINEEVTPLANRGFGI